MIAEMDIAIVIQWVVLLVNGENATSESLIADCWFGGSISCGFQDSGVGGILGANFDFDDTDPGVTIQNCMVVTKKFAVLSRETSLGSPQ